MPPLEITRLVLLVFHFVGLAAIIGPYLLQLRKRTGLEFRTMLTGAIMQVVSGVGLIATRKLQDLPVIDEKMGVKLAIALVVLGALIVATVLKGRGRESASRPWFHSAGGLAVVNVVVAVVWS